jgi:hypothetical protein
VEKLAWGAGLSARYSLSLESTLLAVPVSSELTALCRELNKVEKLSVLVLELLVEVPAVTASEDVSKESEDEDAEEWAVCFSICARMLSAVLVLPDCRALLKEVRAASRGFVESVLSELEEPPLVGEGGGLEAT